MVRVLRVLLLICGVLTLSPLCSAQEVAAPEVVRPLVLRFYDITPLVTPRRHHRFSGGLSAVTGIDAGRIGHAQGGAFGGGGFGGSGVQMGGGGAGFFSVPAEPIQMGGGGFNGDAAVSAVQGGLSDEEPSLKSYLENMGGSSVGELIQTALSGESWESEDGGSLIHDLGNSLMIRQTEKVHAEIAEFLNELTSSVVGSRMYRLEAWWIPVDVADRGQIEQLLAGELEVGAVRQQLTILQEAKLGHHGVLICRERLTNHVASGNYVPVIAGSVPVVGQGATGEQPIVRSLFLGLVFEAQVQMVPDYAAAKAPGPSDQVDVTYRTYVTSRDDKGEDTANAGKIDRYSLAEEAAEGTCRIYVGRPALVSSLSQRTSQKTSSTELQLIMLLTRTGE